MIIDGAGGFFGPNNAIGDFNKDGFADILLGAPHKSDSRGGNTAGVVYFINGKKLKNPMNKIHDLVNAGNATIIENTETDPIMQEDIFGSFVSFGDVNNDNKLDILIGDLWADFNGNEAGRCYIIYNTGDLGKIFDVKSKIINPKNATQGFYSTGRNHKIDISSTCHRIKESFPHFFIRFFPLFTSWFS